MTKISVDRAMRLAKASEKRGAFKEAEKIYKSVLAGYPSNVRARNALSALQNAGANEQDALGVQGRLSALSSLYEKGHFVDVVEQASELAKTNPSSFFLWSILGAANNGLGSFSEAEGAFTKASELRPDSAGTHYNLGSVLAAKGKFGKAITSFERALAIEPNHAETHNALGTALKELGKLRQAIDSHQRAILMKPDLASAHNNLGNALMEEGRLEEAVGSFQKAIAITPGVALVHNNLGTVFIDMGKLDEAVESLQRALQIAPDYAEAHSNLGNALRDRGQFSEAIASYERAIEIDPTLATAYNNLGTALLDRRRLADAVANFERALQIKPTFVSAYHNLGNALVDQGRLDEAVDCFDKVLKLKPDHSFALSQKLHQQAHMCDWTSFGELEEITQSLGMEGNPATPFTMLAREDNPSRQLQRARAYAKKLGKGIQRVCPAPSRQPHEKIRIGYFSGHFHDHATLYLMSGLLREHDRQRFETYAFSYGATHFGEMRERAMADADHFIDVSDMPDQAVVDLARKHEIDIGIDLMGYTQHTRSRLFAHGLAPVQINYLVYPGTMGADFIDYIIADPIAIPESERHAFAEKVIYLPDSYQPNDNKRVIAETQTTRADFGLPDGGVVFCCFNNNYKISPREFDIWMRLLCKVEGSVLWLLRGNRWSEVNLRNEAVKRGIDPDQLVFADRLPHGEHLARHKHADLFVDTFNYNAHTTASDAVWAGLPVITKVGRQFSARVGASLLAAVGLSELVTKTEEDYEALILELAMRPDRLAALKVKLAENRLTHPLFDTARYTGSFERALEQVFEDHVRQNS